MSDSAGVPFAGRHFEPTAFSGDDGAADGNLIEAIRGFQRGELGESDVVDALRTARLLIPLIATLGESDTNEAGLTVDKSAELAIVTVAGPDGRDVLPAFTSVDSMRIWNTKARPVPTEAVRVALAAAGEGTEVVVLDPGSATEFALRRPAVWAIAQSRPWAPSYLDPAIVEAFRRSVDSEPQVHAIQLEPGDPTARLEGPELRVRLALVPGLSERELGALLTRLQSRWAESDEIALGVDSMALTLVAAAS